MSDKSYERYNRVVKRSSHLAGYDEALNLTERSRDRRIWSTSFEREEGGKTKRLIGAVREEYESEG